MKYTIIHQYCMAAVIIIPILIVVLIAASSYIVYALLLRDFLSKRSINQTLEKYNIKKSPFEIIKEYYEIKNESLSDQEIKKIEKKYRRNEPEQFLTMYDAIRDNDKTREQQSPLSYFMIKLDDSNSYLLFYGVVGIEMNGVPPSPTTSGSLPSHACVFSHSMQNGLFDNALLIIEIASASPCASATFAAAKPTA